MRSEPARYELVPARSLDEAAALALGGHRPLAGGTDVMVLLASGRLAHRRWVDLSRLEELRGITVDDAWITLGALTTYREVQDHEVIARELPMLVQAARETGGWAIQNRGTLGGNVANASPAADSPPALLAYDAEVELAGPDGARRWVPYAMFHTGYKTTVAAPGELVARLRVPRRAGPRLHFYRKVGPRRAQAISKVCFAACVDAAGVRVALGGVAPVPLRCAATEAALATDRAGAAAVLAREIAPIDDVRSTARYRRAVAVNLLEELVRRMG